jgi:hypothetical protein
MNLTRLSTFPVKGDDGFDHVAFVSCPVVVVRCVGGRSLLASFSFVCLVLVPFAGVGCDVRLEIVGGAMLIGLSAELGLSIMLSAYRPLIYL